MHFVSNVEYLDGYRLRIEFDNRDTKIVDLSPYLDGPIFEPLKDISFFRRAQLNRDIDTVVWPNNADFSPDFLYEIGQPAGEHVAEPGKQ